MELKYSKQEEKGSATNCSNRTFMELKLRHTISINKTIFSSNRTFMELKL